MDIGLGQDVQKDHVFWRILYRYSLLLKK